MNTVIEGNTHKKARISCSTLGDEFPIERFLKETCTGDADDGDSSGSSEVTVDCGVAHGARSAQSLEHFLEETLTAPVTAAVATSQQRNEPDEFYRIAEIDHSNNITKGTDTKHCEDVSNLSQPSDSCSSSVVQEVSSAKKKAAKGKSRKRLDGIFSPSDDAALVAGILEYGKKWKRIWDEFDFSPTIEHKSLKDRARSKPFRELLEQARNTLGEAEEQKEKKKDEDTLNESNSIMHAQNMQHSSQVKMIASQDIKYKSERTNSTHQHSWVSLEVRVGIDRSASSDQGGEQQHWVTSPGVQATKSATTALKDDSPSSSSADSTVTITSNDIKRLVNIPSSPLELGAYTLGVSLPTPTIVPEQKENELQIKSSNDATGHDSCGGENHKTEDFERSIAEGVQASNCLAW